MRLMVHKSKILWKDMKIHLVLYLPTTLLALGVTTTMVNTSTAQLNPVQRYANNLVVDLTLFGLNSTDGHISAFVNADGKILSTTFNATKLDSMDGIVDGIGHYTFVLPHVVIKAGQPYTTCIVIPSSVKMMCVTSYKVPYPRPEYVYLALR